MAQQNIFMAKLSLIKKSFFTALKCNHIDMIKLQKIPSNKANKNQYSFQL